MYITIADFNKKHGNEFKKRYVQSEKYIEAPPLLHADIKKARENKSTETLSNILPTPKPDPFVYNFIRHKGFVKYPDRLRNFIIAEHEERSTYRSFYPTILDVEPNTFCNFRCIMCMHRDWNGRRTEDLDFNVFKEFVDKQYGLTEVKLQGIGEPLFHKRFINMIQYLVEKYIWVRTTINGSLLHVGENYKHLVDSGVNEVQISFDGATKETFEKIRINSNFDQVVKNLTLMNEYANSKNILISRLWIVLQEYNKHEIFDFVELAKKMSFRRMTFSLALSDWGQEKYRKDIKRFCISEPIPQSTREKLARINESGEIEITFWNLAEKYKTTPKENLCHWPFTRAFISADLRVVPCCMIANPEVADLGDAKEFENVWNSEMYQTFRKMHLQGNIPSYCRNCYRL